MSQPPYLEPPAPPGPGPSGPYGSGPYDPCALPPGYGEPYGHYAAAPAPTGIWARLGPLDRDRPAPRQGIALAAAGAALVLVGILVWGGSYFADGVTTVSTDTGDSRRFLGAGLGFVVAFLGYALVITRHRGPLATAGVVAGALGLPVAIGFATLDVSGSLNSTQLVDVDAVLIVSIVVWVVSYLYVPGARGRAFYVGLAAAEFASYLSVKVGGNALGVSVAGALGVSTDAGGDVGLGGVAAVDLVLGLGYYAAARWLDRTGRHGTATGFVFAGFVATVAGVSAAAPTFEQGGTGAVLIVLGLVLGRYGARYGRRFTTWAWAGGVAAGFVLVVSAAVSGSAAGAGIALMLIGFGVVAVAEVVARALHEPSDLPAG